MKVINKIKNWVKNNQEDIVLYGVSFTAGALMVLIGYSLGRQIERGTHLEIRDVNRAKFTIFDKDRSRVYLEFLDVDTSRKGYLSFSPDSALELSKGVSEALMHVEK